MSLMRLPLFIWMTLVTSILMVLAFPVITVALTLLLFDRFFGMNFFITQARRRSQMVAASLLDIRSSRSLHLDPSRLWA